MIFGFISGIVIGGLFTGAVCINLIIKLKNELSDSRENKTIVYNELCKYIKKIENDNR